MKPDPIQPGPGQESVWDYPRPPKLEDVSKSIRVVFNGETVAQTTRAKRVLETSHPPVYYIPPEDIRQDYLVKETGTSYCEWKGQAEYYSVVVGDQKAPKSAWSYPDPTPSFRSIQGYVAFYAGPMDACYVDGEKVEPQPGQFYGGWITRDVVGPFKGSPGTHAW
jgi:uncharacterized protein (DUF427 family)